VGVARQGDALVVNGQFDSCAWLAVTTEDGAEGWVSGSSQYVTLTARCGELPEVEPPADSGGGTGGSNGGTSGGSDGGSASGSATQGCYLVQNQLGAEVTVTITRLDTNKGETFKLAGGAEVEKCLDPGSYTYTLDAPPPWNSVNGELNVQAGDAFLWPIQGE
jgi:serine protease Do